MLCRPRTIYFQIAGSHVQASSIFNDWRYNSYTIRALETPVRKWREGEIISIRSVQGGGELILGNSEDWMDSLVSSVHSVREGVVI